MSREALYDGIGSRRGFVISAALITFLALMAGWVVWSAVQHVRSFNSLFEAPSLREGVVVSSDINRLGQVIAEAEIAGEMTAELAQRFSFAVDVLYVRGEQFTRELEKRIDIASAPAAYTAMQDIIAFSDAQIAADFPDIER